DLVRLGQGQTGSSQLLDVVDVEIAHPNRTCLFLLLEVHHPAPLIEPLLTIEEGVDQAQADVVQPGASASLFPRAERGLGRRRCLPPRRVPGPGLGGDEGAPARAPLALEAAA